MIEEYIFRIVVLVGLFPLGGGHTRGEVGPGKRGAIMQRRLMKGGWSADLRVMAHHLEETKLSGFCQEGV